MRSSLTIASIAALMAGHAATAGAAEAMELSFDLDPAKASSEFEESFSSSKKVLSPLDKTSPRSPRTEQSRPAKPVLPPAAKSKQPAIPSGIAAVPEQWWQQGSDSPLAVAIGSAEGTRMTDGRKTQAYFWHIDPGNGADNFGTFSYQHLPSHEKQAVTKESQGDLKRSAAEAAKLPELADERQLKKLKRFHDQLRQQAQERGITLSDLELVNALDLANQSEAAALSEFGYIDRLAQMRDLVPDDPEEQILEARTWSYWSPDRHTWDAPGLGNTYENIRQDQARRMRAIQQALQDYTPRPSLPGQIGPIAQSPTPSRQPQKRTLSEKFGINFEQIESQTFQQLPQQIAQTPEASSYAPIPEREQPKSINESQQLARDPARADHDQEVLRRLQRSPRVEESTYQVRPPRPHTTTQQARQNQTIDAIIFYELEEGFV